MRGLFGWAKQAGFVKLNVAAAVRYPVLRSGAGFPVWSEDDVAAYEQRWPLGTRQRVWLAVLLYTGLRRGDAVRLGRQHVRDGVAVIRTEKTQTEVCIPLLPPLLEAIAAGPTADLSYICGSNGRSLTKESFGNEFSQASRERIRNIYAAKPDVGRTPAQPRVKPGCDSDNMLGVVLAALWHLGRLQVR